MSELIRAELEADGVRLVLGRQATRVRLDGAARVVELEDGSEVRGEALIISAGRRPRVHDLGLETIGVTVGRDGIAIDDRCRATARVWAIGDVTGVALFTHVGKYQARIATDNTSATTRPPTTARSRASSSPIRRSPRSV